MPNPAILLDLQYLPPIQFWTKLAKHHTVYLEQHEHFSKGSYRNRCRIGGVNGPLRLSIPLVKGKNQQQDIRAVTISYQEPWYAHHWTSIRSAYGSAPYFDYYADQLEPRFRAKPTHLFAFNLELLRLIHRLLQLESTLLLTDEYHATPPDDILDFRNAIHPKTQRQQPDPDFVALPYPQVFLEKHGFMENLSILDLLFCVGPEAGIFLEQ